MNFWKEWKSLWRWQAPADHSRVRVFTAAPETWPGPCSKLPSAAAPRPPVSLIATVKNEAPQIEQWLQSLLRQSRQPDEIVIVDGGSSDGTYERLLEFAENFPCPVEILREPGVNIAAGRNLAIRRAAGPVIACTDAGCLADPSWLADLTGPFAIDCEIEVCAGYYQIRGDTTFSRALGLFFAPPPEQIKSASFLPSARSVAFAKAAWEKVGGFPEWLTLTGEDTCFDLLLKSWTRRWAFVPDALVWWRPPTSFLRLFRRVRCYAEGAGEVGIDPGYYLFEAIRLLGGLGAAFLVACILVVSAVSLQHWVFVLALALPLTWTAWMLRRTLPFDHTLSGSRRLKMIALCALVMITIRSASIMGFVRGIGRRRQLPEMNFAVPSPGC